MPRNHWTPEQRERIRARCALYRGQAGLTQEEVAKRISASAHTIARYEGGGSTPEYPILLKLANLYSLTTDDFLSEKPGTAKPPAPTKEEWWTKALDAAPAELRNDPAFQRDVESLRKKWTPDKLAAHTDAKSKLKGTKRH